MENAEETNQLATDTAISTDTEKSYILTEDNWSNIPAMIGITEEDLQEFFGK